MYKGISTVVLTVLFIISVKIFSFKVIVCAILANILINQWDNEYKNNKKV